MNESFILRTLYVTSKLSHPIILFYFYNDVSSYIRFITIWIWNFPNYRGHKIMRIYVIFKLRINLMHKIYFKWTRVWWAYLVVCPPNVVTLQFQQSTQLGGPIRLLERKRTFSLTSHDLCISNLFSNWLYAISKTRWNNFLFNPMVKFWM